MDIKTAPIIGSNGFTVNVDGQVFDDQGVIVEPHQSGMTKRVSVKLDMVAADGHVFTKSKALALVVWEAFNGPVPATMFVEHVDKTGPTVLSNLQMVEKSLDKPRPIGALTVQPFKLSPSAREFVESLIANRDYHGAFSNNVDYEVNRVCASVTSSPILRKAVMDWYMNASSVITLVDHIDKARVQGYANTKTFEKALSYLAQPFECLVLTLSNDGASTLVEKEISDKDIVAANGKGKKKTKWISARVTRDSICVFF